MFQPIGNRFIQSTSGEVFYPWVNCLFLGGASWAFVVPSDAVRRVLVRISRLCDYLTIAVNIVVFPAAIVLGSVAIMLAGLIVPLFVYAICMLPQIRRLDRIPAADSFRLFAAKLGDARHWKGVALGGMTLPAAFFLAPHALLVRPDMIFFLPVLVLFIWNGIASYRAIRLRSTE